jgi:hypothetical protein
MADVACITALAPDRPVQFRERADFYIDRFTKLYRGTVQQLRREGSSMLENMRALLDKVDARFIAIIEDDDWYAADYLNHMIYCMTHARVPLVGIDPTLYYHIRSRKLAVLRSRRHCSMFATFGTSEVLRFAIEKIPAQYDGAGADQWLWAHLQSVGTEFVTTVLPKAIGIKHGAGTCYGMGHDEMLHAYQMDYGNSVPAILGDDLQFYNNLADELGDPVRKDEDRMTGLSGDMLEIL